MSPSGPVGYFIIDSLDSLLIAGLTDEYKRARDWVANVSFDLDDKFHTFEITIRVLGGLLSAYQLDGEKDWMLVEKAIDLADRLLPAFDTVSLSLTLPALLLPFFDAPSLSRSLPVFR
jgi:hypothetical protein